MKHLALVCLASAMLQLTHAQTGGYVKKDDGSSGTLNCYSLYEDGTGNTGIGTVAPNASLQINHNVSGTGNDFLSVTQTTASGVPPGSITYTIHSKFIVKENGNVGIGIAEPLALLHVSSNKAWAAADGDIFGNVKVLASNAAGDPFFFASDLSFEDGTNHIPAGFLGVISAPNTFSFGVLDPNNNVVGLGASGDGTVVVNFDITTEPAAQVDIRPSTGTGDILNIGDAGTNPLLRLNANAHLGIGLLPQSGSTVVLYDGAGDTRLDLIASSGHTKALRFMNNNTTPRHVITEVSGDLVIDPGVASGGGNDLLKVAGQTYITAETGIGLAPTSSTLSIKGSSFTFLDLVETSTSVAYNAQLRFLASDGSTVRHLITENSTGELLIKPGYGGGAVAKVKIDGELETADNVTINGSLTVLGSSDKQFKVYADGKVRAREVQVDLETIPDYVFNSDYQLKPIEELAKYLKANKHLPNIPGECDYDAKGCINLGELNLKLLEKVEELSLYIIQLNERIKILENGK
jgi:hypothetical protein